MLVVYGFRYRTGAPAADILNQLRSAFQCFACGVEIDTAFKAIRGIRGKTQGSRLAGYGVRCEKGAFQKQICRSIRDTAFLASHDAGQRQCAIFVGNQGRIRRRHNRLLVQQQQLLAMQRVAHMYGAS